MLSSALRKAIRLRRKWRAASAKNSVFMGICKLSDDADRAYIELTVEEAYGYRWWLARMRLLVGYSKLGCRK